MMDNFMDVSYLKKQDPLSCQKTVSLWNFYILLKIALKRSHIPEVLNSLWTESWKSRNAQKELWLLNKWGFLTIDLFVTKENRKFKTWKTCDWRIQECPISWHSWFHAFYINFFWCHWFQESSENWRNSQADISELSMAKTSFVSYPQILCIQSPITLSLFPDVISHHLTLSELSYWIVNFSREGLFIWHTEHSN